MFIEDLLLNLEIFNKREQELFDVENHILWVGYRDYKFKIYLDAERGCLYGEVRGIKGWCDSDSLTHLIEQLERIVDYEINCNFQKTVRRRK